MYRIIYIYVWFSIFNIWLKACFTLAGETAGDHTLRAITIWVSHDGIARYADKLICDVYMDIDEPLDHS